MAPGDNNGGKLSWPAVKKLCSPGDIDRLACLAVAYINGAEAGRVYHDAAKQFGGNIKAESYKRALWVISKKIKDAGGAVDSGNDDGSEDTKKSSIKTKKSGVKRKASSSSSSDETPEGEVKPRRAKKVAKGAAAAVKAEDGEAFGQEFEDIFS